MDRGPMTSRPGVILVDIARRGTLPNVQYLALRRRASHPWESVLTLGPTRRLRGLALFFRAHIRWSQGPDRYEYADGQAQGTKCHDTDVPLPKWWETLRWLKALCMKNGLCAPRRPDLECWALDRPIRRRADSSSYILDLPLQVRTTA